VHFFYKNSENGETNFYPVGPNSTNLVGDEKVVEIDTGNGRIVILNIDGGPKIIPVPTAPYIL